MYAKQTLWNKEIMYEPQTLSVPSETNESYLTFLNSMSRLMKSKAKCPNYEEFMYLFWAHLKISSNAFKPLPKTG